MICDPLFALSGEACLLIDIWAVTVMTIPPQDPESVPQEGEQRPTTLPARESDERPVGEETKAPQAGETSRVGDSRSIPISSPLFSQLPVQLGRYRVIRLLGSGAMGAVFLAEDTQLERSVALKVPKVPKSGAENLLRRMKMEAKALAKIDNPHICKIYDFGIIDECHFIAMEYIDGEDLKSIFKRVGKQRKPIEAIQVTIQLAKALNAAHEKGVIHRDLKPENVMRKRNGQLVIMDFGLARQVQVSANAERTQGGAILGSAAYMSPEQASGRPELVDARSDLYALGVMLFEMLTGEWPFIGNAIEIMGQKATQKPPSPIQLNPVLPTELAQICQKMLARRKQDRYASCEEVIAALKGVDLSVVPEKPIAPSATAKTGSLPETARTVATLIDPQPFDFLKDAEDLAVVPSLAALQTRTRFPSGKKRQAGRGGAKNWRPWAIGGGLAGLALLFALLFLQTKQGVLVIDIGDPSLSVHFDGNTISVNNDGRPIQVSPTAGHTLQVLQDGITVDGGSREITLSRGETRTIKVSLIDGQVAMNGERMSAIPHTQTNVPARNSIGQKQETTPVSLEEWLKGRDILTVKQDGTAMFATIQEALDAQKDGQVVKILDRGPYRERLTWSGKNNCGLVSDMNPIILTDQWENRIDRNTRNQGDINYLVGHEFSDIQRARVSGMTFLFQIPAAGRYLVLETVRTLDLCIDQCDFVPASRVAEGGRPEIAIFSHCDSASDGEVTLSSCVFNCRLALNVDPMNEYFNCNVTRNWFYADHNTGPLLNLLPYGAKLYRANVQENIIDGPSTFGWKLQGGQETAEVTFRNNSVVANTHPSVPLWVLGSPGDNVSVTDNLHLCDFNSVSEFNNNPPYLEHARQHWILARNYSPNLAEDRSPRIPISSPATTQPIRILSRDPFDRDYMRIDADSIRVPAEDIFPGALPAGAAPTQGDWFTRLQDRWRQLQGLKLLKQGDWGGNQKLTTEEATTPSRHADRDVAKWVISIGGSFNFGQKSLPPGDLKLNEIALWSNNRITSADLARFEGLKELTDLRLGDSKLDASAIPQLMKLRSINRLSINDTGIPGRELTALRELPVLHSLGIDRHQLREISEGPPWKMIREIHLTSSDGGDLERLDVFPHLARISFSSKAAVSEAQVAAFQIKHPYTLVVTSDDTGNYVAFLGANPQKNFISRLAAVGVEFTIWSGNVRIATAEDLKSEKPFSIKRIKLLPSKPLTDDDFAAISQIYLQDAISASHFPQPDRLVKAIADQTSLRQVTLSTTSLNDADLKLLEGLPNLSLLTINETKVTRQGIESFHKKIPGCRIVSDFGIVEPDFGETASSSAPVTVLLSGPEPPSLQEWLQGREILTVKQDGSAMFKTIQSALDAQKDGQVVRVLDRGPYVENLVWANKTNCGLVTDQGTVISISNWKKSLTEGFFNGHEINNTSKCRLHGFSFVFSNEAKNEDLVVVLNISNCNGFCIEKCVVVPLPSVKLPFHPAISVEASNSSLGDSLNLMRDNVLSCLTALYASSDSQASSGGILMTRNWSYSIQDWNQIALQVHANDKNGRCPVLIKQNVIHNRADKYYCWKFQGGYRNVSCSVLNNTLVSPGGGEDIVLFNDPPVDVAIMNNLHFGTVHSLRAPAGKGRFLADRFADWKIERNYSTGKISSLPDRWPLGSQETCQAIRYLSRDPLDRNYMRIDPMSIQIPQGDPFPGALPPGPAPAGGDWLTDIQDRWRQALEDIKAIQGNKPLAAVTTQPSRSRALENSPDREIAKWILSQGGTVNGVKTIPEGPFQIRQVLLEQRPTFNAEEMERLTALRQLTSLSFRRGGHMDDSVIPVMLKLRLLNYLEISHTGISGKGIAQLSKLNRLKQLAIDHRQLSEMDQGTRFQNLRSLYVVECEDSDLKRLNLFPKLIEFRFYPESGVSSESIRRLQQARPDLQVARFTEKLNWLSVGENPQKGALGQLLDKGIIVTGTLALESEKLDVITKPKLADATYLKVSIIQIPSSVSLTPDDFSAFSSIYVRYGLTATGSSQAQELAEAIADQTSLKRLDLSDSNLNDDGFMKLESLINLEELLVPGTDVTRHAVEAFHRTLPTCRIQSNFGTIEPDYAAASESWELQPVTTTSAIADPDREVAKWVLSMGGNVNLHFADGTYHWVGRGSTLPTSQFTLYSINLMRHTKIAAADLERLTTLRDLHWLNFSDSRLDTSAATVLGQLKQLTGLSIANSGIPGKHFSAFETLHALEFMSIDSTQLAEINGRASLRAVNRVFVRDGDDSSLDHLQIFPCLYVARFEGASSLSESAVREFHKRAPLVQVLLDTRKGTLAIADESRREAVRVLAARGVKFTVTSWGSDRPHLATDEDFRPPNPLTVVQTEIPSEVRLAPNDVLFFSRTLVGNKVVAKGCEFPKQLISAIADQTPVNHWDFSQSSLTDGDLQILARMPELLSLTITETDVTRAGIAAFHKALPRCQIHSDFGTIEPDYNAEPQQWELKPIPNGESKSVENKSAREINPVLSDREVAEWITAHGGEVNRFMSASMEPFRVKSVTFGRDHIVDSRDIERLRGLKDLNKIGFLRYGTISDSAMEELAQLPTVQSLSIETLQLSSRSLEVISKIPSLTELCLSQHQVTHLANISFPNVRDLLLIRVTDDDLSQLSKFPKLNLLTFSPDSDISENAVTVLKQQKPNLLIVQFNEQWKQVPVDMTAQKGALDRLIPHGVSFRGEDWSKTRGQQHLITQQENAASDVLSIGSVSMPEAKNLSAEDLQSLSSISMKHTLFARNNRQTEELLDAISDQLLLYRIDLTGARMGDQELKKLEVFVNLRLLELNSTQVTRAGIDAFHRVRPRCQIRSDFPTVEPDFTLP